MNNSMWIGKKVITISNGFQVNPKDNCLKIGEVVGIDASGLPLIKYDDSDTVFLSFATCLEYDEDLYNSLLKLTAKERYNIIMAIVYRFKQQR